MITCIPEQFVRHFISVTKHMQTPNGKHEAANTKRQAPGGKQTCFGFNVIKPSATDYTLLLYDLANDYLITFISKITVA